jgi:hypothetical protein
MSKAPTLDSIAVVRKGEAMPPPTTGSKEPSKEGTKEPRKEPERVERRRPWDGQDDVIKANYEVPRRIQTKLHTLKAWGRIGNLKGFVAEALEKALDKEIAAAEKEGY